MKNSTKIVLVMFVVYAMVMLQGAAVWAQEDQIEETEASSPLWANAEYTLDISAQPYDTASGSETQMEYHLGAEFDTGLAIGVGFFSDEMSGLRPDDYYLELSYWLFEFIYNPGSRNWHTVSLNFLGFITVGYNFGGERGGVANLGAYDLGKQEPERLFWTFQFDYTHEKLKDFSIPLRYDGDAFGSGIVYHPTDTFSAGFIRWDNGDYSRLYFRNGVRSERNEFFIRTYF